MLTFSLSVLLFSTLISPSLHYKCTTDEDCNLNGICKDSGSCSCDPGWEADDCGALDIRPGPRNSGYNLTAQHTSSWGSKIMKDPRQEGLWHAFLAEFTHGCGLDYWSPYSRIVRTVSTTGPLGPYYFAAEVAGTFAHNPTVVWSSADREYLLYYIGCPTDVDEKCTTKRFSCGPGNNNNGESGISVMSSPDLYTWTLRGQVFKGMNKGLWDDDTTNPSPFSLGDTPFTYGGPENILDPSEGDDATSEILLAYRGCHFNCSTGKELISLASASSFEGPYARLNNHKPIFPNPNEDPFLWRDKRGNFHLLMHSLEPDGGFGDGPKIGRHAYSRSIEGPWTFNNRTLAFSTLVEFDDGTSVDFYRRERPQLLFSDGGSMRPLILSTGVQEEGKKESYSVMVPIGAQDV